MNRRALNLGIAALSVSVLLPNLARSEVVDVEAALRPRVEGDPKAKLTMLEYSSLTCPHCAPFHNGALPQIRETYTETRSEESRVGKRCVRTCKTRGAPH